MPTVNRTTVKSDGWEILGHEVLSRSQRSYKFRFNAQRSGKSRARSPTFFGDILSRDKEEKRTRS